MFENQNPQPPMGGMPQQPQPQSAPGNLPDLGAQPQAPAGEIEDIFSGINTGGAGDKGVQPPILAEAPKGGGGKKVLLVILVLIIAALIIVGGVLVYMNFVRETPPVNNGNTNAKPQPSPTATPYPAPSPTLTPTPMPTPQLTPTPVLTPTPEPSPVDPNLDSDSDGLTDGEEGSLNTNPFNADTDADGLNDKDEVKKWQTDPLNPDSDGDGYKDGEEVSNGYNPNGAGKLEANGTL